MKNEFITNNEKNQSSAAENSCEKNLKSVTICDFECLLSIGMAIAY